MLTGGLSGCRREGDTSGVSTSCPSFGLGLGLWHLLSSLRHQEAYTIEDSSTPRRKCPAMCGLVCSTWCASRSTSIASVIGASMLLARGLGAGPNFLTPFCSCSDASSTPSRRRDRVQAEHNTRPAFLAIDFLARLRSTVQYVQRQLHWCALHHVALPVRLQHHHVFWCQTPRRRQIAPERHPCMHVRGPSSSWASARSA